MEPSIIGGSGATDPAQALQRATQRNPPCATQKTEIPASQRKSSGSPKARSNLQIFLTLPGDGRTPFASPRRRSLWRRAWLGRGASLLPACCSGIAPVLPACCPLGLPLGSLWAPEGISGAPPRLNRDQVHQGMADSR